MTIKRLRFVRRAIDLPADGFGSRWAAYAAALAAAVPLHAAPACVVHCIVRTGKGDRPFHGVAIEWFSDEATMAAFDAAHAAHAEAHILDETATVCVRVHSRAVFGQALLDEWHGTADGRSRIILLGVIHRQPTLSRAQFADYWWSEHRPLANALLPADVWPPIYVHDYVLPGEEWPWDGVGEFYDDSLAVAKARTNWADGDAALRIVADEEAFLVRDTRWSLVTDATVLVPRAV